jgi:photosystem II stability/assembly factor-like uncharacterized protein
MYRIAYLIIFSLLFFVSCTGRQKESKQASSSEASPPETTQSHPQSSQAPIPAIEEVIFINVDTVLVFPGYLRRIVDEKVFNQDRVPLITRNGGESWEKLRPQTIKFYSIDFINALQGWLVNDDAELWKTTDGGVLWNFASKIEYGEKDLNDTLQIKFIDELNGLIVGLQSLLSTEDGGITWSRHRFPGLVSNFFIRGQSAWIAPYTEFKQNNIIYKTQNGGETWMKIDLPKTNGIPLKSDDIYELFFIDEQKGWLATEYGFYRTDDGGENWQKQEIPPGKIGILSLFFIDEQEGWAAGQETVRERKHEFPEFEAILLHTTNGGNTWQPVNVATKQIHFEKVYFGDTQNGWLVANDKDKNKGIKNASMYRTYDGGKSWTKVLVIKSPYNFK